MRSMSTAVPGTSWLWHRVAGPGLKSDAVTRLQVFRTRMMGLLQAALAAVAVAATLGASPATAATSAAIIAPTNATLPRGLPILVQWTPSMLSQPTPTVSILLHAVASGGGSWSLGTSLPNNGQATVNLPQSLPCDPTKLYFINIHYSTNNNYYFWNHESPHFKFSCGGSIVVSKTVINNSGGPVPNGTFQVDVNCGPGGPNTTLSLSSASGFQASVMHIPLGSQCSINEQAPKAPPGCRWLTTYPQGKSVLVGNLAYQRAVHNRLSCQGTSLATGAAVGLGSALGAKPLEGASGSLTIVKKVINGSTSFPPPNVPFHVQVTCTPGGPITPITLSAANNFQQVVGNIPADSACTFVEQAPTISPDLARDCRWDTIYPDGQNVVMPIPATALKREVVNRWNCK